jgi:hypothetical protein
MNKLVSSVVSLAGRVPKKIAIAATALAAIVGISAGVEAHRASCCHPGAACCYPGSPCCNHGHAATPKS